MYILHICTLLYSHKCNCWFYTFSEKHQKKQYHLFATWLYVQIQGQRRTAGRLNIIVSQCDAFISGIQWSDMLRIFLIEFVQTDQIPFEEKYYPLQQAVARNSGSNVTTPLYTLLRVTQCEDGDTSFLERLNWLRLHYISESNHIGMQFF